VTTAPVATPPRETPKPTEPSRPTASADPPVRRSPPPRETPAQPIERPPPAQARPAEAKQDNSAECARIFQQISLGQADQATMDRLRVLRCR
jgi:hypothetical protein